MKNKMIALFAIVAVFGLAVAAYAYTTASNSTDAKASCCSKSDSCPMKAKMAADGQHAKESCPMKSKAQQASMTTGDCCCDCCGDSCPMKKGETKATAVSTSDGGSGCCDNCECCKGKHESAA